MQRLSIYKNTTTQNTAHLYEHLYCYALDYFFLSHKLYTYVDYHYDAKTYANGLIQLDTFLFTPEAEALALQLTSVLPDFSGDSVSMALIEILAEKQCYAEADEQKVIRVLKQIDKIVWRHSVANDSIVNQTDGHEDPLILYPAKSNDFTSAECQIVLGDAQTIANDAALPLFYIVATALLNNVTDMLAREYAYFGIERSFDKGLERPIATQQFRIHASQASETTEEVADIEVLIEAMKHAGLVRKLAAYLNNATYDMPLMAPDKKQIRKATGMHIDVEEWRKLGTPDTIQWILDACEVRWQFTS
ncbi:hypothetical protein JNJ66_07460 [Candidatus Saccharibacteria bacterium]|nr:hypothetical protein [Candidatus Saccharibacteria bacterium]